MINMKTAILSLIAYLAVATVCNPIDQHVIGEARKAGKKHGHGQDEEYGRPKAITISPELFAELDELARIVDISYCVGTPATGISKPFSCLSFCSEFPSFELIKTWNTGPLLSDSCGYIALSHPPAPKRIILAFRGTYSVTNALVDLSTGQQEYVPYPPSEDPGDGDDTEPIDPGNKCMGCWAHKGFLDSWKSTADEVIPVVEDLIKQYDDKGYQIELIGHSLGGAVAALAALEFTERGWKPKVTTFGEPKVGNLPLATYLNSHFTPETYRRVTHKSDPVPLLPFRDWGFIQHETEFYIEKLGLPQSAEDIRVCEGNEDETCIAGEDTNIFQILYAHRDYFHRMGLCVPQSWRGPLKGWLPWNFTISEMEESEEGQAVQEIVSELLEDVMLEREVERLEARDAI